MDVSEVRQIGFILTEGFSMIGFSNAIEVFRMANYVRQSELYRCRVGGKGAATAASNGIAVCHNTAVEDLDGCELIFVCGGFDLNGMQGGVFAPHIRRLAKQGRALGGICTGAFLLADAGVLDGYQASIHWENMVAARETFPAVGFNTLLYTTDRGRYTCSGGTASLDMCLSIIREQHGRLLSEAIAEQFTLSALRNGDEYQHLPAITPQGSGHQYVTEALVLMDKNLEEPLPVADIAALLDISVRQLERCFKHYLNRSPQIYYIELRLQHARRLLRQTNKSVTDIALACGFANLSGFSKAYRNRFSQTPSESRRHQSGSGC